MKKLFVLLIFPVMALLGFHPLNTPGVVTGTVTDASGNPIAGAIVTVKGGKINVSTDAYGAYSIQVPAENVVLSYAAVGYVTRSEQRQGRTVINVILKASTATLQEIVLMDGTGKADKRNRPSPSVTRAYTTNGYNALTEFNTEGYDFINENTFHKAKDEPLSTFSIDVDAASYSNVRRYLNEGALPPAGAVRIEEMINYFKYDYPRPTGDAPFSFFTESATCPWNEAHQLVMIGMQGKQIPMDDLPASNLVFLIDVSGSMGTPNKLPLVKSSLKLLTDQLREQDKVSIVVYAGAAGLVLSPTSGAQKQTIKDAIDRLESGGSTAGGDGIKLAYKTARQNFAKGKNNRVILCTDGDFNIGMSSDDDMERLVEKERNSGVYLTVLGYGMGNYKDNKMQKLADKGNGNHAYIDGMSEAKKVLVNEFGGTLFTIAKDVKLQVEFNPAKVQGYRLVGYENRMLNKEDFNDDTKDAGEMGSGHTVTALYEIIPVGVKSPFLKEVDDLKYQQTKTAAGGNEMMTIKFRYKDPESNTSKLIVRPVKAAVESMAIASQNLRFAASVASFGMLLRNSAFKGTSSYANVLVMAQAATSFDKEGYRKEFIDLVKLASKLPQHTEENDEDVAGAHR